MISQAEVSSGADSGVVVVGIGLSCVLLAGDMMESACSQLFDAISPSTVGSKSGACVE